MHRVVIAVALLAACSDGVGERRVDTFANVPSHPLYAVLRSVDYSSGYLMAEANYGLPEIHVYLPYTLVPAGQEPPRNLLPLANAYAQGIAVGRTSGNAVYVLVVLTDFSQNSSSVVYWTDADADGLPDSATKTVLATLSNVHLTVAALDRSTGTLYAFDGLNNRVLRWGDHNADRVPDGTSSEFGSTAWPVLRMASPTVDGVRVYTKWPMHPLHPQRYVGMRDTDGDGAAEEINEEGRWGPVHSERYGRFLRAVSAGESSVEVAAFPKETWRVEAVQEEPETLATFEATNEAQIVNLDRSVVAGERIVLVLDATGEVFDGEAVLPGSDTVISGRSDPLHVPSEGGTLTFAGKNIQGNETVEVRVLADIGTWTSATVASSSASSLTVNVPELGVAKMEMVEWRIVPVQGSEYRFLHWVEPGGN